MYRGANSQRGTRRFKRNTTWQINASDGALVMTEKKNDSIWSCFDWWQAAFQYLVLDDGAIVEVLEKTCNDPVMLRVRVLEGNSAPAIKSDYQPLRMNNAKNLIGTIRACWLVPNRTDEVIEEHSPEEEEYPMPISVATPVQKPPRVSITDRLGDILRTMDVPIENKKPETVAVDIIDSDHNNISDIDLFVPMDETKDNPNNHDNILNKAKWNRALSAPELGHESPEPVELEKLPSLEEENITISVDDMLADLPWSHLKKKHLLLIVEKIRKSVVDKTYQDIFAMLHQKYLHDQTTKSPRKNHKGSNSKPIMTVDGPSLHHIIGKMIKHKFQDGWLMKESADVLFKLSQHLRNITIVDNRLIIQMNFNRNTEVFSCPTSAGWVLESNNSNPKHKYKVGNGNKVHFVKSVSRNIVLNHALHMTLGENGVIGIDSGEMNVKMMMQFEANIRTEYCPGRLDIDEYNRPYLVEDMDGNPIIKDGYYVPRYYDNWMVITVLKRDIWMGMAPFSKFLEYCFKDDVQYV